MTTPTSTPPSRTELTEKLNQKEYRDAFVASRIRRGLPLQIRAIREALGWSQDKLAEMSGIAAPNISRAENTRDTFLSFPTLLKIAAAFDMALVVKFASFSELEELATRPVSGLVPPSFAADYAARESRERAETDLTSENVAGLDSYLLGLLRAPRKPAQLAPKKARERYGIVGNQEGGKPSLSILGADEPKAQGT